MKKKYLIIFLSSIIFILIATFSFFFWKRSQPIEDNFQEENIEVLEQEEPQINNKSNKSKPIDSKPVVDEEQILKEKKNSIKRKKELAKWKGVAPQYINMETIVINLTPTADYYDGFLQVELSLEYFSKKEFTEFSKYKPIIHHEILLYLSSKTQEDILDIKGKEKIQEDILDIINKNIDYNKKEFFLHQILFSKFIKQ